jgi:hypothetical protein
MIAALIAFFIISGKSFTSAKSDKKTDDLKDFDFDKEFKI